MGPAQGRYRVIVCMFAIAIMLQLAASRHLLQGEHGPLLIRPDSTRSCTLIFLFAASLENMHCLMRPRLQLQVAATARALGTAMCGYTVSWVLQQAIAACQAPAFGLQRTATVLAYGRIVGGDRHCLC